MKSISKSYGVPGVRLGVLASGDTDTIAAMKKDVAIWNINSYGEFFLQIKEKYEKIGYKVILSSTKDGLVLLLTGNVNINQMTGPVGISTVVSVLSGIVFLKEEFSFLQIIGLVIIIAGVYTANSKGGNQGEN